MTIRPQPLMRTLAAAIAGDTSMTDDELYDFQQLNPMFWKTDFVIGEYYVSQHRYDDALQHYRLAASRAVTTAGDRELLQKRIKKCERAVRSDGP